MMGVNSSRRSRDLELRGRARQRNCETPHGERELQRHASREDPQYEIMSDKTDHVALHNTSALKKLLRR